MFKMMILEQYATDIITLHILGLRVLLECVIYSHIFNLKYFTGPSMLIKYNTYFGRPSMNSLMLTKQKVIFLL